MHPLPTPTLSAWEREKHDELERVNAIRKRQWEEKVALNKREYEALLAAKTRQESEAAKRAKEDYDRRVEKINSKAEVERAAVISERERENLEVKLTLTRLHDTATKRNFAEHAKVLPALKKQVCIYY